MRERSARAKPAVSLRRRLIAISYASVLLSMLALYLVCWFLLQSSARRSRIETDGKLAAQISENLSYSMVTTDTIIRNIIYSHELQRQLTAYTRLIRHGELDETARLRCRLDVNSILKGHANTLSTLGNLTLYGVDGELLVNIGRARAAAVGDYPWYKLLAESQGESLWLTAWPGTSTGGGAWTVPVAKRVRSLADFDPLLGSDIGYFLADVNLEWFFRSIEILNYESATEVYLVDEAGHMIGENQPAQWGGDLPFGEVAGPDGRLVRDSAGGTFFLTSRAVKNTDWYVVCASPYSITIRDAYLAAWIVGLAALTLLCVFFIVSLRNANVLVRPVAALGKAFRLAESGDLSSPALQPCGIRELDELNERFGWMMGRIDTLVRDVYTARLQEQALLSESQRSQIQALQMQMNPHFLYNALDSINWMAMIGGNQDVSRMVLALSEMLRYNLSMKKLYIPLAGEVANVERYLYIQCVRFQPRLRYTVDLPPALANCAVLKLLIQPLAENAVRHGMAQEERACNLALRVWEKEEHLYVEMADDGAGMPPAVAQALHETWRNVAAGTAGSERVGLPNLMRRLYLCYGAKANFELHSSPGQGTRVVLSFPRGILPLEEAKEEAEDAAL